MKYLAPIIKRLGSLPALSFCVGALFGSYWAGEDSLAFERLLGALAKEKPLLFFLFAAIAWACLEAINLRLERKKVSLDLDLEAEIAQAKKDKIEISVMLSSLRKRLNDAEEKSRPKDLDAS